MRIFGIDIGDTCNELSDRTRGVLSSDRMWILILMGSEDDLKMSVARIFQFIGVHIM